jgi:hypothetical protein
MIKDELILESLFCHSFSMGQNEKNKSLINGFIQTKKRLYNTAWGNAPGKKAHISRPSGYHSPKAQNGSRWLFSALFNAQFLFTGFGPFPLDARHV